MGKSVNDLEIPKVVYESVKDERTQLAIDG